MRKLIKIYGERNTSTNYFSKLIHLNKLPGNELVRDLYFLLSYKRNLGWKHTRVKSAYELKKYGILKNAICFVSITKNPYSWLISLYRRPYCQYYSEKPKFETFLCTPWKTVGRDNCNKMLKNPIELWNIKNSSYLQLADLNGLNITTESILKNPNLVINKISNHFSIDRLTDKFVNHKKSTKDKNKNFTYYRDFYLNEKWRDNLSTEAISIINETVDKNLMNHFGYEVLP